VRFFYQLFTKLGNFRPWSKSKDQSKQELGFKPGKQRLSDALLWQAESYRRSNERWTGHAAGKEEQLQSSSQLPRLLWYDTFYLLPTIFQLQHIQTQHLLTIELVTILSNGRLVQR
jgi:hypothetical protein